LILKTGHRSVTAFGSPDHCIRRATRSAFARSALPRERVRSIVQNGHLPAARGSANLAGFRKSLRDSGFIEGQNVAMIE